MQKGQKKDAKTQQAMNYVKLAVLFLVVIILALGIRKWYLNSIALEFSVPVISDTISKEIKVDELYSYVNENDPAIIYFSVSSDSTCRSFEKEFSSFLRQESLEDVLVYMNLNGKDVSRFFNDTVDYYQYEGKLDGVPALLYFENGQIQNVLTKTSDMDAVRKFFQEVGLVL